MIVAFKSSKRNNRCEPKQGIRDSMIACEVDERVEFLAYLNRSRNVTNRARAVSVLLNAFKPGQWNLSQGISGS